MNLAEQIINTVCAFEGINKDDFQNLKSRKREIVQARQRAHYFLKQKTKLTLQEIGWMVGGKDHATVLHSVKTVDNMVFTDFDYRDQMKELAVKINNTVAEYNENQNIKPKMQLQIRFNNSQYCNGRYIYSLYGHIKASKNRTIFLPVNSFDEISQMIDVTQVDSMNLYMDYRSANKVNTEKPIKEVRKMITNEFVI